MKNEIVKVNDVDIECPFVNDQHFVAVKPICQALGIDHSSQIKRLQLDGILGSVVVDICTTTGTDGKQYKMICIPVKFVFGWLFMIDENRVKQEARETLIRYKLECYNILYEKFVVESRFYKVKTEKENEILNEINDLQTELEMKKETIKKAKKRLETVKAYTYEDFKANGYQMAIAFPE